MTGRLRLFSLDCDYIGCNVHYVFIMNNKSDGDAGCATVGLPNNKERCYCIVMYVLCSA